MIKNRTRSIRNKLGFLVDIYLFWRWTGYSRAKRLLESQRFDFLISSFSPPAAHIVAHKLKNRFPNVKWIADFRDLWAFNHVVNPYWFIRRYEKYREKKILRNADLIVTVSEPLKYVMQSEYRNKRVITIENGYNPDEFPNWEARIKPFPKVGRKIVISYFGSLYEGKQDPSPLLDAVYELILENKICRDQILIEFYTSHSYYLNKLLQKYKYTGFVKVSGIVSRKESLEKQRKSTLLLFLEWNDPNARGVLTGKLFEYLVSGTPILSVGVGEENEAGKLILNSRTGVLTKDKTEIKKVLMRILNRKVVDFFNPNIEVIRKYSRRRLVEKLVKYMEEL